MPPDSRSRYYAIADENLVKICRFAIDRSCCQLENIDIADFGTDDLLAYIADCAGSSLRRLGFDECYKVSEKGFIECVRRLPLIEELDISYNEQLSKDSIDVVGRCCPLLKSLKYGKIVDPYYIDYDDEYIDCNDEAFAIAETMPGLHHLTISGTVLDYHGVLAILDGCPLLESLDLSNCKVLYLGTSLENRFFEQIKNAALPCSFSDDDDFY
ncbi:hypothetical protein P8452_25907 [Trifolium repens]|nr:hypothetical protein P8452_25907 [Trifolium repens]